MDHAAFDFVESLTTEIGQRLAGTEAHRRAVAWAEAKLKAAGFENVHSEPFTFPAWIRGAESAEIVGSVPQHLAVTAFGGSVTARVVLFGAEEMNFSGAAYAQAHEGETGKIVVAGEADFGARNVYYCVLTRCSKRYMVRIIPVLAVRLCCRRLCQATVSQALTGGFGDET